MLPNYNSYQSRPLVMLAGAGVVEWHLDVQRFHIPGVEDWKTYSGTHGHHFCARFFAALAGWAATIMSIWTRQRVPLSLNCDHNFWHVDSHGGKDRTNLDWEVTCGIWQVYGQSHVFLFYFLSCSRMVPRKVVVTLLFLYMVAMLAKQSEGYLAFYTPDDFRKMQVGIWKTVCQCSGNATTQW